MLELIRLSSWNPRQLGLFPWRAPTQRERDALAAEWRKKLHADGFRDVEYGQTISRRHATESIYHLGSWTEREAVAAYYRKAEHFTHRSRFYDLPPVTRQVWRLHARGQSNREIALELGVTVKRVRVAIWAGRMACGLPGVTRCQHGRFAKRAP